MRVRNCSMQLPWEVRLRYINRLMAQMMWSGYSQSIKEIVARRLIAKIDTNLYNLKHLDRPIYRSREERRASYYPYGHYSIKIFRLHFRAV